MYVRLRQTLTSPDLVSGIAIFAGFVGAIVSYLVGNPYTVTLSPLLVVGGIVGYLVQRRSSTTRRVSQFATGQVSISLWTIGAAYVLVAGAVASSYVMANFSRTLPVHVGLVVMYLLVLLGIFAVPTANVRQLLPLTLVTGVFHRGLIYYASATQLGVDALFHTNKAALIAQQGTLEPLIASKYWYAPVLHLVLAGTSSVLGVSVRDAGFLVVTIPVVVVVPLVVYTLLRPIWNPRVAMLGGLLYLVADHAIAKSVHVTPTSLGVVFFAVLLLLTVRYLENGASNSLPALTLLLVGLVYTHVLSLLIATVGITAYVAMRVIWRGGVTSDSILVPSLFWIVSVFQGAVTRYNGPNAERTIVDVVVANFAEALGPLLGSSPGETSRQVYALPAGAEFTLGSSDALSPVHTLGIALLFCLGVIGIIQWLKYTNDDHLGQGVAFGATVAVMSVLVFSLPIVGINLLLPTRWLAFLYLPLAVLAAPGLLAVGTTIRQRSRTVGVDKRDGVRMLLVVSVVLAIFGVYGASMMWNKSGSYDGPVFDESPTAQRLTTTPTEKATYRYATQSETDTTVIADRLAVNTIGRGMGHPADTYSIIYGDSAPNLTPPALIVDRAYAHTNHASYAVFYRGRWITVFGPLPQSRDELATRYSLVYAAGSERVFYVS